jgi:hypothetical protein
MQESITPDQPIHADTVTPDTPDWRDAYVARLLDVMGRCSIKQLRKALTTADLAFDDDPEVRARVTEHILATLSARRATTAARA